MSKIVIKIDQIPLQVTWRLKYRLCYATRWWRDSFKNADSSSNETSEVFM